jgi:hypothetical protein
MMFEVRIEKQGKVTVYKVIARGPYEAMQKARRLFLAGTGCNACEYKIRVKKL